MYGTSPRYHSDNFYVKRLISECAQIGDRQMLIILIANNEFSKLNVNLLHREIKPSQHKGRPAKKKPQKIKSREYYRTNSVLNDTISVIPQYVCQLSLSGVNRIDYCATYTHFRRICISRNVTGVSTK